MWQTIYFYFLTTLFNQSAKAKAFHLVTVQIWIYSLTSTLLPHHHPRVPSNLPPPFITCMTQEYTGASAMSIYHYSERIITITVISKLYVLLQQDLHRFWETKSKPWSRTNYQKPLVAVVVFFSQTLPKANKQKPMKGKSFLFCLTLEIRNTSTTAKTWIACSNSHLACAYIQLHGT